MTLKKSPNVQEIRGRFENWNNDGERYKERVIIPLGKPPEIGDNTEARKRSFSVFTKGTDFTPNNTPARNNSFQQRDSSSRNSHFKERQKLVESIVANIKSSSNEKQKSKSYKNVLNSIFDKEIKSLVRGQKRGKNNERQYKENKIEKGLLENAYYNQSHYNNYKEQEATKNFQSNISDNCHIKSIYDNIADKYINNLNLEESSNNQKLVVKPQFNSFGIPSEPYQRAYESLQEPLRPPRRRVIRKKYIAPSPPNVTTENAFTYSQVSFPNSDQLTVTSNVNLSTVGNDLSSEQQRSMNERSNSAGDLYPFNRNRDTFPSYRRDPFNNFNAHDSSPEDMYSIPKHVINKGNNQQIQAEVPCGPPPKKPPRTFAHDIYRQGRQMNITKTKKELDDLYAKPMKKTKRNLQKTSNVDQEVLSHGSFNNENSSKPPIAPKPHSCNYKRYSVIEPIESSTGNKSESTIVKRDNCFRFSFRKPRSSSPMASKPIARFKDAVRNFHFKREHDTENRLSRSEEYINKNKPFREEDTHIYETPYCNTSQSTGTPKELHYMCSPLFHMESQEGPQKEKEDIAVLERAKVDWGGLRKDFRQSCRMVQKRLRGVVR